jgi:uncharacterized protein
MRVSYALALFVRIQTVKRITKRRSASFFRLFLIVSAIVLIISYISMRKLLYISKDLMMGKERLDVCAKRIREKMINEDHARTFECTTEDNITLHGLIVEHPKAKATILLCHGYQCCKELTAGYIKLFPNYNFVMFDFRAHGENKRTITTIGCHEYKDVLAVGHWIKQNKPNLGPLIILGVSMGGASALKAVEVEPTLCDALIVDSAFSSLESALYHAFVNKSGLPTFPFLPIMKKMFNYAGSCDVSAMTPLDSIKNIKQPLLIIHSCVDRLVPVQESLLMYAQGAQQAKLWIAPKCKHGWLHKKYPDLYKKKVISFLEKRVLKTSIC